MCFTTMFSDSSMSMDSDKAEGATILQVFLQTLGDYSLQEELWKAIFSAAI